MTVEVSSWAAIESARGYQTQLHSWLHGHGVGSVASMLSSPTTITEWIAQVVKETVFAAKETASGAMALRVAMEQVPEQYKIGVVVPRRVCVKKVVQYAKGTHISTGEPRGLNRKPYHRMHLRSARFVLSDRLPEVSTPTIHRLDRVVAVCPSARISPTSPPNDSTADVSSMSQARRRQSCMCPGVSIPREGG